MCVSPGHLLHVQSGEPVTPANAKPIDYFPDVPPWLVSATVIFYGPAPNMLEPKILPETNLSFVTESITSRSGAAPY